LKSGVAAFSGKSRLKEDPFDAHPALSRALHATAVIPMAAKDRAGFRASKVHELRIRKAPGSAHATTGALPLALSSSQKLRLRTFDSA
jgi:hypothetical protein